MFGLEVLRLKSFGLTLNKVLGAGLLSAHGSYQAVRHANKTHNNIKMKKNTQQRNRNNKTSKATPATILEKIRNCFSSSFSLTNRFASCACTIRIPSACLFHALESKHNSQIPCVCSCGTLHKLHRATYSRASVSWFLRCAMLLRCSCFSNFVDFFLLEQRRKLEFLAIFRTLPDKHSSTKRPNKTQYISICMASRQL